MLKNMSSYIRKTVVVFISIVILVNSAIGADGFKFDVEPEDTIVPKGGSAVLNCVATGDGDPVISWRKDGAALVLSHSDERVILRNGSLHIISFNRTGESRPDEGLYQCAATLPGYGTILSRLAKIQGASLARFDEEPEDISIGIGQTARFSCSAQGVPPPTVVWFRNENLLPIDRSRMTILPSGSLEIRNVQSSDEGAYKCNISNIDRSYLSRTGRLVLNSSPDRDSVPVFTAVPKSQTVVASESVVLECSAVSYPQPSITWLKDGVTIDFDNPRFTKLGDGNLVIVNAEESDRGTYQCRAQNSIDSADVSAKLDVHVTPRILSSPTNFYAYQKEDVELPCNIYGKPTPTVQWYKDGAMIIEGDYFQIINRFNLKILGLLPGDGAMYQCIGTNPAGNVQQAVRLQVLKAGEEDSAEKSPRSRIRPYSLQIKPDVGQVSPNPRMGIFESGLSNTSYSPDGPSAPRDLMTVLVSTRFVTLTWKPPLDPNGRIIAYAIVYQEVGSDRQRVFNTSRSKLEEVNVPGLQPNKQYSFKVIPYNDKGPGRSSSEIIVTTQPELDVPGPPRNVKAWSSSSSSINVEWAPPEVTNGVVLKYKVFYSESSSARPEASARKAFGSFSDFDEKSTESEDEEEEEDDEDDYFLPNPQSSVQSVVVQGTEVVLEDLRTFADYAIWVAAVNEKGQGANSEQVQATTLGAEPGDPPQNVTFESGSSTSMALRWDPPALEHQNGIITGYKIKYKQKGKKKADTVTTDGNSRFYALNDLEKGTEYQVRIAAINVNGTGPFTEWFTSATFQRDLDESQVPDKPGNLVARPTATSITIAWTPPKNSNIMVRGYTIGWGKGIPDEYSKLVDVKRRTFTMDKLRPNSDYVISLRAFNNIGDGVPIYANVITREDAGEEEERTDVSFPQLSPPVGLRAIVVSSTSVVLYWTDTSLPKTQIISDKRYYVIRYYPYHPDGIRGNHKKSVKQINSTQLNTIIDGLKPGTQYEFSVKTVKGRHASEWSLVAHNTTFEAAPSSPPEDLTLLALTGEDGSSSIILNWQPPRPGKFEDILKGYVIFYTTDPSLKEWVEDSIPEDVLTHKIIGLTPETVYYFRMAARYLKGLSAYTEPKSISTPASKKFYQPPPNNGFDAFPGDKGSKPSPIILYALIAICIIFAIASVALCIYYRNKGNELSGSPKQNSLKKQRKQELKPPDLWIHHDHMELKNIDKSGINAVETPMSPSIRSSREIGDPEEKTPLQHSTNSLDKRNFMSSYIGEHSFSSQCHSLGRRRPKPIRMPVEPFNFKPDVGGGGTADLRNNPLFQRNSQSQSHMRGLPPGIESPNGHAADSQKTYDHLPSGSSTASSQQNINSLVHYGSGSEYGTQQIVTTLGTLGRRSGANLKSFAVPVPPTGTLPHHPTTPQQGKVVITARPMGGNVVNMAGTTTNTPNIQNSPIKRISTSQFPGSHMGYQPNMPPSPRHFAEDPNAGGMQKCYSTEELSQEISNLEGLMKDLNAITANEFQC